MTVSVAAVQSAVRATVVCSILLCAFLVRVVTAAAGELSLGREYAARGDQVAAIVHLRRAARWYAPGSPYHVEALSELATIGAHAERDGDAELALSAYRGIRSAIMSARSFYVPQADRLAAANARIADLMAARPPPPMDAGKSREQLRKEHLALLTANHDPALGWTLLLLTGLLTWVSGAYLFTRRAIDGEHFVPVEVRRWGTVIVVGLGMFVLGLAMA